MSSSLATPPPPTDARAAAGSHYCPHCLRRVGRAEIERRACRESCRSGTLDVVLLVCAGCGLVLTAEIAG